MGAEPVTESEGDSPIYMRIGRVIISYSYRKAHFKAS